VVAPQNTVGEGHVLLTGELEAEGVADAVRRGVGCRRERMHEPLPAIVAGQLEQHPYRPLRNPASRSRIRRCAQFVTSGIRQGGPRSDIGKDLIHSLPDSN